MADAGELRARATLDNAEFLGALKQLSDQVAAQTQASAAQFEKVSESIGGMATALEGVGLAEFLTDFASEALDAGTAIAKLQTQFENLNGPTEETQKLFEGLRDLQLHSLFDFQDTLGPAAETMLKLGVNAAQVGPAMQAIVDAASGLKEGPQWITAVSTSLGEMQAKSVASARDMKALTADGVPAWQALADFIGTSMSGAMDQVKKGMITGQEVTDAVTAYMEERWGGAAEATTDSWKGAMHLLSVETDEAQEALGQAFIAVFNEIKPAIDAVAGVLESALDWFKQLPQPAKDAVIAFGAVLGAITALGPILAVVAAAASPFLGWALAIGAVVAALVLLGEWVASHWDAIAAVFKQVWDAVAQFTGLNDVIAAFSREWQELSRELNAVLPAIKQAFTDTFGWIPPLFKAIAGSIDELMNKVPGLKGLAPSNLKATWDAAQQAQDKYAQGQADAAAADKAASDASKTAYAQQDKDAKTALANQLAQANAEKARAAAAKQAASDASKAATEEKQYNDALLKTYDALLAISPQSAQAFSDAMGGISTSATKAQQLLGTAWAKVSADTQQMVTDTLAFGEALKALGLTTEAQLTGQITKAAAAYDTLSASGKATQLDLVHAWDDVVAAQNKFADNLNKDVKKAFDDGSITAAQYYQLVVINAQNTLADVIAAQQAGLASATQVAAAQQEVILAAAAQQKQAILDTQTAYKAFGLSTSADMTKAIAQWSDYAAAVAAVAGAGSFQAITAQIGALQAQQKILQANNQDLSTAQLAQLKTLQTQLESLKTPTEQLADAYKTLGLTSIKTLNDSIDQAAQAVVALDTAQKNHLATAADVYAAHKKLEDEMTAEAKVMNEDLTAAYKAGLLPAEQYFEAITARQAEQLQGLIALGTTGPEQMDKIAASIKLLHDDQLAVQVQVDKDLTDSYAQFGLKSASAVLKMQTDMTKSFQQIVADAGENSLAAEQAWVNMTAETYKEIVAAGDTLTQDQKNQLAQRQQDLKNHLDISKSMWQTTYDGVTSTMGTAFDALAAKIATGKGFFSDILTTMFDGLKTAAIQGFIEPFKDAITKLIANELANLVSSLTGIGSQLGGLGSSGVGGIGSLGGIFGGSGGGGSTGIGLPGVGGAPGIDLGDIGSSASSAVSGASSSIMGVLNPIGAIGSAVSAITGVLQLFGVGQQGQKDRLNNIDNATTMLAQLFGQPVQGILAILNTSNQLDNLNSTLGGWVHDSWAELLTVAHEIGDSVGPGSWLHDFYANSVGPALDTLVENSGTLVSAVQDVTTQLQSLTVQVTATGATTADAARAMGDQIAKNLTTQLARAS